MSHLELVALVVRDYDAFRLRRLPDARLGWDTRRTRPHTPDSTFSITQDPTESRRACGEKCASSEPRPRTLLRGLRPSRSRRSSNRRPRAGAATTECKG